MLVQQMLLQFLESAITPAVVIAASQFAAVMADAEVEVLDVSLEVCVTDESEVAAEATMCLLVKAGLGISCRGGKKVGLGGWGWGGFCGGEEI